MTSRSKLIGGILLIIGTSIGGGMLALPLTTAPAGVMNAALFLFICWLVMTAGALLILEVNIKLPMGSNMVSMAKSTLGVPGQVIAWVTYLFLLYTLLAAYISGGSDIFNSLLKKVHLAMPNELTAFIFTALFSLIIYKGIRAVDYVNRSLMFAKLGVYILLISIFTPHVNPTMLQGGSAKAISGSLMVLITSFGFATLVPSLREYFNDDVRSLRKVILWGSLIPLICYILWIVVITGVIAREGKGGLIALMTSKHATSGLMMSLSHTLHNPWITGFFDFFTSICMITAFLGVSLGLFDFLADGLKLQKTGHQGKLILALTFLPPLAVVLVNPGIYINALNYAGVCCIILLLALPVVMAWRSRKLATETNTLSLPGGDIALVGLGIISVLLLVFA